MKNWTKFACFVLVLSLLLSGCGQDLQPTAPSQPTENESVSACGGHDGDPYEGMSKEEFYTDYSPACCYADASYRSKHYFLSGALEVPGQYAQVAENQPTTADGMRIRNTDCFYEDNGKT